MVMAIRPIVIAPDPVLKKKAEPIAAVDDEIRQLMDDMLEDYPSNSFHFHSTSRAGAGVHTESGNHVQCLAG